MKATRMGRVGPVARSGRTVTITKYLEFLGPKAVHWELECEVKATVYPGEPGVVNAPIDKCYPPTPPEIDYDEVVITHAYRHDLPAENGKPVEGDLPGTGITFTPGQFEFMAKLAYEGPEFEMASLDPDVYEEFDMTAGDHDER